MAERRGTYARLRSMNKYCGCIKFGLFPYEAIYSLLSPSAGVLYDGRGPYIVLAPAKGPLRRRRAISGDALCTSPLREGRPCGWVSSTFIYLAWLHAELYPIIRCSDVLCKGTPSFPPPFPYCLRSFNPPYPHQVSKRGDNEPRLGNPRGNKKNKREK